MDKNRLCTALYALPGDIVVKHRKPLLVPLLMAAAGAGLLGLNAFLEDAALNNLKSAIALVGGTLLVIGAVWALARLSGSQGTPYHRPSRSFMRSDRPDRRRRSGGVAPHAEAVDPGGCGDGVPHARQRAGRLPGVRVRGTGVQTVVPNESYG